MVVLLQVHMPHPTIYSSSPQARKERTTQAAAELTSVVTAINTVKGLQSLVLSYAELDEFPSGLFLPLTAAAGGPGSNLKKLELIGDFRSGSHNHSDVMQQTSNNLGGVKQLDGLNELCITRSTYSWREPPNIIPVDIFPASLRVLKGYRLTITSPAAAANSGETTICNLRLRTLNLDWCTLTSPSMMFSDHLEELTVNRSSWSGGWPAADWPNVRKLTWKYSNDLIRCYRGSEIIDAADTFRDLDLRHELFVHHPNEGSEFGFGLQQICVRFRNLKWLILTNIPQLSVDILQPIVQHQQQLHYLALYGADCVKDPLDWHLSLEPTHALQSWLQRHLPGTTVHMDCHPQTIV